MPAPAHSPPLRTPPEPPAGWATRLARNRLAPIVLIVVAVCVAYGNSLRGPFIFDDLAAIGENPHLRHLWPLSAPFRTPAGSALCGRPIANVSFAVNYALGGLEVYGYHVFNLLFHGLAALTLYGVVRRALNAPRAPANQRFRATLLATLVALVWAVHPLTTSTVTYVVQRTELLMALFYLLTLYCFFRGAAAANGAAWFGLAVIACTLGMGCKEVMVSAPVMVLLCDRGLVSGSGAAALRRRWGLYLGLAGSWLYLASLMVSANFQVKTGAGFQAATSLEYARTQSLVLLHYLRLSFWPRGLVLDYLGWPVAPWTPGLVLAVGAVLLLLVVTASGLWRRQAWALPAASVFLILAPTSSFLPLQGELVAERRMYLPLAAVVVLVVGAIHEGASRSRRLQALAPLPARVWPFLAGALLAVLVAATLARNAVYHRAVTIWADTAAKRPGNYRAFTDLGVALDQDGDPAAAIRCYQRAIQLKPDYAMAHANLGVALAKLGRFQDAVQQLRIAVGLNPQSARAHYNLGLALKHLGDAPAAAAQFREALRLNPRAVPRVMIDGAAPSGVKETPNNE